jgi:elongation factor G
MSVELDVPEWSQGNIIGEINRRRGVIESAESDTTQTSIRCVVPLQNMFGFYWISVQYTRKGEFSMEYKKHSV